MNIVGTGTSTTPSALERLQPVRLGDVVIQATPPSKEQQWWPPYNVWGGSLAAPLIDDPITDVRNWRVNADVSTNRYLSLLGEYQNIKGAIGQNFIGLLYRGYTRPSDLYERIQYTPMHHASPYKNATITIPMANCLLLTLGQKYQQGILSDYSEEYVKSMFGVDGIFNTVTGDDMMIPTLHGGYRQGQINSKLCGVAHTKNLWGGNIEGGTPLYIALKKFAPTSLGGLPYNVDPRGAQTNAYTTVVSELQGGYLKGPKRYNPQWVWQFVPVNPSQTRGNGKYDPLKNTEAHHLYYRDEMNYLHEATLYRICFTRHYIEGAPANFDLSVIPPNCVNTSLMAMTRDIEVHASVIQ
jgi:hypothetical protein